MPCYEVNLMEVKLKGKYKEIWKKALSNLGLKTYRENDDMLETFDYRFNWKKETIEFSERNQDGLNKIKREYTAIAVEAVAKKRRWVSKRIAQNKFQLAKY